jgi:protein gp37
MLDRKRLSFPKNHRPGHLSMRPLFNAAPFDAAVQIFLPARIRTGQRMGDKTGISWTTASWNPTAGCSIKSPGCTNCYAMKQAHRLASMTGQSVAQKYAGLTKIAANGEPVWTGAIRLDPASLDLPLRWTRGRLIFVNSMSDLFHEDLATSDIDRVFAVMDQGAQHVYQILTKRPERMLDYLSDPETPARIARVLAEQGRTPVSNAWPLPHVWAGTTVEDQPRAAERIPLLRRAPAAVRFLSCEPLIAPVRLGDATGIHWVIVGGESGSRARPMHPDWARALRDECAALGIPFHFKQVGAWAWIDRALWEKELRRNGPDRLAAVHPRDGWLRAIDIDGPVPDGFQPLMRTGKGAAGDLLDGVRLQAFPPQAAPFLP